VYVTGDIDAERHRPHEPKRAWARKNAPDEDTSRLALPNAQEA
jgi:hypothetical protein